MKYTFQTDSAAEGLRIDACIRRFCRSCPPARHRRRSPIAT